jgi:hypothetical protein
MKATPHLLVAGVLVVIALFASASSLLGGSGSYPVATRDLRVIGPGTRTDVVPAERATAPLVADLAGLPSANPFSERRDTRTSPLNIPLPPPPRLEYPPLPVLPVPVK